MHKTERFGLVLSPQERIPLERLARAEGGLSQVALLRRRLTLAARKRGLWPSPHESSLEKEVSQDV
jgi:hypothetical protein